MVDGRVVDGRRRGDELRLERRIGGVVEERGDTLGEDSVMEGRGVEGRRRRGRGSEG